MRNVYLDLPTTCRKNTHIKEVFAQEENKFFGVLKKGHTIVESIISDISDSHVNVVELAKRAFDLFQSAGYPFEILVEEIKDARIVLDEKMLRSEFDKFLMRIRKFRVKDWIKIQRRTCRYRRC